MTKKQILQVLNDKSTYILDFKDETHNAIELEDFNDVADAILSLCSSSLQLKEKGVELNRIKRIEWLKGVTEYTIWADYVPNGNSICDKFEDELKYLQSL